MLCPYVACREREREKEGWRYCLLIRTLLLSQQGPWSIRPDLNLTVSLETHVQMQPHWELGFQYMNFGRTQTFSLWYYPFCIIPYLYSIYVCVYLYTHTYVCMCVCVYVYVACLARKEQTNWTCAQAVKFEDYWSRTYFNFSGKKLCLKTA